MVALGILDAVTRHERLPIRSAYPAAASRSHTTGHLVQRGEDSQQDFFTLTVVDTGLRSSGMRLMPDVRLY